RHMEEPGEERLDILPVALTLGDMGGKRLPCRAAIVVVAERPPGDAEDAGFRRHLAVAETVVERRQKLAEGKVAGPAEHGEVEGFDGDDAARHAGRPSFPVRVRLCGLGPGLARPEPGRLYSAASCVFSVAGGGIGMSRISVSASRSSKARTSACCSGFQRFSISDRRSRRVRTRCSRIAWPSLLRCTTPSSS